MTASGRRGLFGWAAAATIVLLSLAGSAQAEPAMPGPTLPRPSLPGLALSGPAQTEPALAAPASARTRVITGQAGILGEWELTSTVTEQSPGGGRWAGPLGLKHVGFCSADGPEEKTGELRLLVSEPPGEVTATMRIDGNVCTFSGRLTDGYDGVMSCPGRRDVPMLLLIQ